MNRSRLLMIGSVAVLLGLFVSYAVYRTLQARVGVTNQGETNVVVAAMPLQVGTKLEDRNLRVVRMPAANLPAGYFKGTSQIAGRGLILPVEQNEIILPGRLAAEKAGSGLPSLIPTGMRAVSVRVNEVVSVAGFVTPGSRVDVLLTGNPAGGHEKQTTTVLSNAAVIATGQRMDRNGAGDSQMAAVITLLVTPEDAQRLTLASSEGRIQLVLRNPLDTGQQELAPALENALYQNDSVPAPKTNRIRSQASAKPTQAPPYKVETIRGDKVEVTNFPDAGSGDKAQ